MAGLAVALIVLAVILALVGFLVEAVWWLLIVAAVLLVLGVARAIAGRINPPGGRRRGV